MIPLMAAAIVALMVSAAFAVDLGYWRYQQRIEQTAADSAAMAGAVEYAYTGDATQATTSARTASATNGFTHNGTSVTVAVNMPPTLGAYTSYANAIEVIVSKQQPTFFARYFGRSTQTVQARAVALLTDTNRNCIYALDDASGITALTVNGANVQIPKCGMVSNSNLLINGSTVNAGSIAYVGSSTVNGSTLTQASPRQSLEASDPCSTVTGCRNLTSTAPTSGACLPATFNGLGTAVIPSGTYCSTLIVNGCSNVTFSSGTFVLDNGMTVNGSPNISGSAVTFYNKAGTIVGLNGSGGNLAAPTSGTTSGVLMYQVASDTNAFVYNGSSGGMSGALYFPGAQITLNGSVTQWLLAIGKLIVVNGAGLNVPSSAFPGYAHAVLAE